MWGVPSIAAENFKKGHGFKTSLRAGFDQEPRKGSKQIYVFSVVCFFSRASRWMLIQMIMVKKE